MLLLEYVSSSLKCLNSIFALFYVVFGILFIVGFGSLPAVANLVQLGISVCCQVSVRFQYLVIFLSMCWVTGNHTIHSPIEGLLPLTANSHDSEILPPSQADCRCMSIQPVIVGKIKQHLEKSVFSFISYEVCIKGNKELSIVSIVLGPLYWLKLIIFILQYVSC